MLDQFTSEQIAIGTGISISTGVTLAWLLNEISEKVSDIYYKDRTIDVSRYSFPDEQISKAKNLVLKIIGMKKEI